MKTDEKSPDHNPLTHFGYQQVSPGEKTQKVGHVFSSVASRYDIMNDMMSLGLHRVWKRTLINWLQLRPHEYVLDLAGGTADLTTKIVPLVQPGHTVLADINADMLSVGRNRLLDKGLAHAVHFVQANAECLPFPDNSFDCVVMAFGLRNVTDKDQALAHIYRILKPGGRFWVLEFSTDLAPGLSALYHAYSFKCIPAMGELMTGDRDSYQYLVESIQRHPKPQALKNSMQAAGFEGVGVHRLSGGIVVMHKGYKY